MDELVFLQCFEETNKLRVRIISTNYLNNLNCKFPRSIRKRDRLYCIESKYIKLNRKPNRKDFYDVTAKYIQIIEDGSEGCVKVSKIYTDEEENCCICLSDRKYYVFADCGHYYVCKLCYDRNVFVNCPICRSKIKQAVPFEKISF